MNRALWPHQEAALLALRQTIGQGVKRVVLQAPTGAGKTLLAVAVVDGAMRKGNRMAFVVPSISLIDQTVEKFYEEGIHDVGVIQANHSMTDWSKPVQVCSVQTLAKRGSFPEAKIVIIDEVHALHDLHKKWLAHQDWQAVPFIGLSATPWTKGLGKHFHTLLIAATTQELIDKGHLSKFTVFACPKADLSEVKVVAGDYQQDQLSGAMQGGTLTADIVKTWEDRWGKDKTLVFAVNRAHAEVLHARFEDAGIRSAYQDGETCGGDRSDIRRGFHNGTYQVVVNIGTLCLDEQTEILTSDGWVGIDAMTMQHKIAAWDESGIEFTQPLGIVRRQRQATEKMVSVAGKVHNIRVTENHRMQWSTYPWNFKIKPAESLVGKRGYLPVSGQALPAIFDFVGPHFEHQTKKRSALSYKYRKEGLAHGEARSLSAAHVEYQNCNLLRMPHELTFDDCAFIGFWLGDGSRATSDSDKISFSQSERNFGIIKWIDDLVGRMGLHVNRRRMPPASNSTHHSIRWEFAFGRGGKSQQRVGGLSYLDDYLNKNGSTLYWGFDRDQFMELLHGYWIADGNHGVDGLGSGAGKQISGANKAIFDLLQAIGSCRGIRIGIRNGRLARYKWAALYFMSWLEQTASCLIRERLEFETDFKEERVWCVTSTTGNLITRRAGKVTVVGNTTGVDWDVRCLVLARPTKSEMLLVQILGRALRTALGKEKAIILDHSETCQEMMRKFGSLSAIGYDHLDDGKPKPKADAADRKKPLPKPCPQCASVQPRLARMCGECGHTLPLPNGVVERNGVLVELTPEMVSMAAKGRAREYTYADKMQWLAELKGYAEDRGKSDKWVLANYRQKFDGWPPRGAVDTTPAMEPSFEVSQWIKSRQIAWAKGKEKAARMDAAE